MSRQAGVWIYSSLHRQGSYRLVLVQDANSGTTTAERQRFHADDNPCLTGPGDVKHAPDIQQAVDWLQEKHLQLTHAGWTVRERSGLAKTLELSCVRARRLAAIRMAARQSTGARKALRA